jgi:hypothetical protein
MKYKIGDKVRAKKQSEVHEVVGIIADENGIVYKVTSKEVDIQLKEVVNGFSFYKEDELENIK